jgi:hypothetical protein
MKFNIPEALNAEIRKNELRVGNVYAAKGGKGTAFWVAIALHGDSVSLLGINREGGVVSATSYYRSVFEGGPYRDGRPIMGFVEGLGELAFDVQWGVS